MTLSISTQTNGAAATNTHRTILCGLTVVAITFVGFFGWAAYAELSSAVIATGTITVDSNRKAIQHREGGMVKQILVRNGDAVHQGQLLLRLDETQAQASVAILQGKLYEALANEARLIAERNGAKAIVFPEVLLERTIESQVSDSLSGHQGLFEARRETLMGETEIYRERIVQIGEQITGLRAQQESKARQIALIAEELGGLRKLLHKGFAGKTRILALERETARLSGERGEHMADIAAAKTAISQAEMEILQVRKSFRENIEIELRQVRARIIDLRERVVSARFMLDHLNIRAPEDGVVVGLEVHAPGQVVQPGATILELVPVNDELIVEARVLPLDIDSLSLGLEADVIITAFQQRTTPYLKGSVAYFSADRIEDARSGEVYYLARISIPEQEVARLDKDQILRPGMPADVMIKTGTGTALSYFIQPLKDSMMRAWRES